MLRGKKNAAPVLPARVSPEGINTRTNLVEAAFVTIRAGLMQFTVLRQELLPARPQDLADIEHSRRDGSYETLGITVASNGFVLNKITGGGLVDNAHRLKVPTDGAGDPEYHRDSFNVDAQCVHPASIDLVGCEEIGSNPDAVVELLGFERDIVYASLTNWAEFFNMTIGAIRN